MTNTDRVVSLSTVACCVALLGGCATSGMNGRLESLEQRNDSLMTRMARMEERLQVLDTIDANVKRVKVLTDFLGLRIASEKARERSDETAVAPAREIPVGVSFAMGPADAELTIVSFMDFQCPYCLEAGKALDSLQRKHPKRVRWVFKHFPLDSHGGARSASIAAISAGKQGKFFEYAKLLMSERHQYSKEDYLRFARILGLDLKRFESELANATSGETMIEEDVGLGKKLEIRGTPTLFLNGRKASRNSFEFLDGALSQLPGSKSTFDQAK